MNEYRLVISTDAGEREIPLGKDTEDARAKFEQVFWSYIRLGWTFTLTDAGCWAGASEWNNATMGLRLLKPRRPTREILRDMRRQMEMIL